MNIGQEMAEVVTLLLAMYGLIQGGIVLSCILYISHSITDYLSRFTRIEEPDPTLWKRIWERFYERNFHSFGLRVTRDWRDPTLNGVMYQLAIGGVVVLVALGAFVVLTGATLGAMIVSYHSTGYVPNWSHLFDQFAAGCLLFAFAIVYHSTTKSIQSIKQERVA